MSRRLSWAASFVAWTLAAGCVLYRRPVDVGDPAVQSRMAVTALAREDYASARPTLLDLAARCQSGEYGRRAVLLLAASELDTGNEAGSPQTALQLARSYLLLPDAPSEEVVLARALYRLAADLGGHEAMPGADSPAPGPRVAPRFDGCESSPDLMFHPLPSTSSETLVDREQALMDREQALVDREQTLVAEVAATTDSLATVRQALSTSRERVTELESELERITQLLTSGAERHSVSGRP